MSPDQADATTRARGLEPFEKRPDPAKYDPMTTRYWSLAMAVSWIVWLDAGPVRQSWSKFRSQYLFWAPRYRFDGTDAAWDVMSHDLERLPPATIQTISLAATDPSRLPWLVEDRKAYSGPRHFEVSDARERLWESLADGALRAYAVKTDETTLRKIKKHNWGMLETRPMNHGISADADALYPTGQVLAPPLYRHILVDRVELVELWPSSAGERRKTGLLGSSGAPQQRSPRTPSAQHRAVLDFIETKHAGGWPVISDVELGKRLERWLSQEPQRRKYDFAVPITSKTLGRIRKTFNDLAG